jgi:hypothetical protein
LRPYITDINLLLKKNGKVLANAAYRLDGMAYDKWSSTGKKLSPLLSKMFSSENMAQWQTGGGEAANGAARFEQDVAKGPQRLPEIDQPGEEVLGCRARCHFAGHTVDDLLDAGITHIVGRHHIPHLDITLVHNAGKSQQRGIAAGSHLFAGHRHIAIGQYIGDRNHQAAADLVGIGYLASTFQAAATSCFAAVIKNFL